MDGDQGLKYYGEVDDFLETVTHKGRREDADTVLNIMQRVTGMAPRMWGDTLIGYDRYHYKYDSGHEGDSFKVGFSPRKANMVIYINPGFSDYGDYLDRLGPHKTGASCLYLGRLNKLDLTVLEELIARSYKDMVAKYPA